MTTVGSAREAPRVMFVHAHPDDESSKGAATVARYVAEGADVSLVTCTDGRRGGVLNPSHEAVEGEERLAALRARELREALAALGVARHWSLGYPDSGYVPGWDGLGPLDPDRAGMPADAFYRVDPDEATSRLVALVRAERPHVLVTYPPDGDCPHPDHRRTHDITARAFDEAGDASAHPGAGSPWSPSKLYHTTVTNPDRTRALAAACRRAGLEPVGFGCADDDGAVDASTTFIEVADFLEARRRALLAHASQIDPEGPWLALPVDLVARAYPYEAFTLARRRVETILPERSLVAGLDGPA